MASVKSGSYYATPEHGDRQYAGDAPPASRRWQAKRTGTLRDYAWPNVPVRIAPKRDEQER